MSLATLGWTDSFASAFQPYTASGCVPARVALEHKHAYELLTPNGAYTAACTGKLLHAATARGDLPAVGDWVAVRLRPGETHADIHTVLPRRTKFSRRAAGGVTVEQIVAANVDTVLLVTALDQNFNLRRIERYLAVAWESGAQPVVVLNKADLHPDPAAARAAVAAIAPAVPILALSALAPFGPTAPTGTSDPSDSSDPTNPSDSSNLIDLSDLSDILDLSDPSMRFSDPIGSTKRTDRAGSSLTPGQMVGPGMRSGVGPGPRLGPGLGLVELAPWLVPGQTLAFLGSSGVGKSTLINRLLGAERQVTNAISDAVGKGRHTTTQRELIVAPSGVLVIDTPGMRELQLWDVDEAALDTAFADIAAFAARCKFRDCSHRAEPGCAIQAALDDGSLDSDRWQSFQKLQREQAYAARKADPRLARQNKADWKKLHHQGRANLRMKHGTDTD